MSAEKEKLIVFVDGDDSLVRSTGSKRIPMPRVVERVKRLRGEGATLYLWCSGGADDPRASAEELGILDCFAVVCLCVSAGCFCRVFLLALVASWLPARRAASIHPVKALRAD